jgi:DNA primase
MDARIDMLVDALDDGLDRGAIDTILGSGIIVARSRTGEGMGLPSFAIGEGARAQLVDVIGVLTERPQVERAHWPIPRKWPLKARRLAEQQRLRRCLHDVQKRNWI